MYTIDHLYQRIMEDLMDTDFLARTEQSKELVLDHLKKPRFKDGLERILHERDFSCQSIYQLCQDPLDKLWGAQQPEHPLYYIYQYVLRLSFPDSIEIHLRKEWEVAALFYLHILRWVCHMEKCSQDSTMVSSYPLNLLTHEECEYYQVSDEYYQFKEIFSKKYLYEMMKLNQDVLGFNTLDHICGVHHLALFIGKQLYHAGLPVDLGRVSGAATGHDLGKFGCKSCEGNRVAYLHYYYTDLWFKRHHLPFIGHIALNHSVWDLELENLSIESLILIYSDFRVKNHGNHQGKYEMTFFTLQDSFDIIRNKLDNVDQVKEKRYQKVYSKLKDFEDYIIHLGIQVELHKSPSLEPKKPKEYYAFMRGSHITEHLKYLAINHNIHLMGHFRDETSLNEILEIIRSEDDPRNLREYLDVLQEYSTYLTQKQKIILLRFLYEKLIHPEEDIRRQCAEHIGNLIAFFDEDYRKEVPEGIILPPTDMNSFELLEEYLELFIHPNYRIIPLHRQWIGYSTKLFITSIFSDCSSSQEERFKRIVLKFYTHDSNYQDYIHICLLDVVGHLPLAGDKISLAQVFDYIETNYNSKNPALRIASLKALEYLFPYFEEDQGLTGRLNRLLTPGDEERSPAENYLTLKLFQKLKWDPSIIHRYHHYYLRDLSNISSIFLSNLKTATDWITKKVQVKMLLEYLLAQNSKDGLYTAIHYCNLLKVSGVESVRNGAGKALVDLMPHLPLEQRNDIAIELLRALELEGYQFTKYIPNYLGQVALYLKPRELNEFIKDIKGKIKQSNPQIKTLLLRTVGFMITHYPGYKNAFKEGSEPYWQRLNQLLGILLNGLAHDDQNIRQISFSVLGKDILGSRKLCLEHKFQIFQSIGKKILTLLSDTEETQLLFLTNSSGLNHIYRFISEYSLKHGPIFVQGPEKLALFSGSFDPFTLSHKEICRTIRNLGFEVYLAVDEFSWSKRTQPHLIRKKIINMSIADELDIYLYPDDFPINIASPRDLKRLKDNFGREDVYIVVGSDVIINASAYRENPVKHSIHHFPHIIFERTNSLESKQELSFLESLKRIKGEVLQLNIPPQFEDISSSQIRSYVDLSMDISNLIDPLAQKYIHENSLYRREPQYKSVMQTISIDVKVMGEVNDSFIERITSTFHDGSVDAFHNIKRNLSKPEGKLIVIEDLLDRDKILAYGMIHWIPSDRIYQDFEDIHITEIIREYYKGRIISIDGIFIDFPEDSQRMYQIILTEVLAYCLKKDYGYAIYHNTIETRNRDHLMELVKLQGFIEISKNGQKPILAVDMSHPCTLNLDLETLIKEPFKTHGAIKQVIGKTRIALQRALTELYPGNLVMSFHRSVIDQMLARKVCEENNVPLTPTKPRELGPYICVPFGNILSHAMVPNTVTKSLHVEKMFHPDMNSFTIGAYPYYLDLNNQIKMIGSFHRPVILVDDLLHKGYRLKGIEPVFKKQGIHVHKVMVAILSGKGKEIMDIQNREVDSAYFIPKLRLWFYEKLLYPFIGGDTLWRGIYPKKNLLSSINLILPYTSPHFIKGVTNRSVYQLSEVSILNAIKIFEVLEEEYQRIYERKLTLSLLSDVFLFPRYPDAGQHMQYDFNVNPSSYLKNDLETLRKLEHSIITGDERRE